VKGFEHFVHLLINTPINHYFSSDYINSLLEERKLINQVMLIIKHVAKAIITLSAFTSNFTQI